MAEFVALMSEYADLVVLLCGVAFAFRAAFWFVGMLHEASDPDAG